MELNGAHQLLVYNDDANIFTIKKNKQALSEASKEVDLQIKTMKTKYILTALSCHRNSGQKHISLMANKFSENVTKFKYLRTRVIN
jgi:exopolysaccharide biosynthesis predicted pyruvyltransferase EpsI